MLGDAEIAEDAGGTVLRLTGRLMDKGHLAGLKDALAKIMAACKTERILNDARQKEARLKEDGGRP